MKIGRIYEVMIYKTYNQFYYNNSLFIIYFPILQIVPYIAENNINYRKIVIKFFKSFKKCINNIK